MRVISLKTALDLAVPSIAAKDVASSSMGTGFRYWPFRRLGEAALVPPSPWPSPPRRERLDGHLHWIQGDVHGPSRERRAGHELLLPGQNFPLLLLEDPTVVGVHHRWLRPVALPCNRDEALAVVDLVTQGPSEGRPARCQRLPGRRACNPSRARIATLLRIWLSSRETQETKIDGRWFMGLLGSNDCHPYEKLRSSRLAESESVVNSTAIMQPFTIYA